MVRTATTEARYLPGRWLVAAVLLSLLTHLALYVYFRGVDVGFGRPMVDPMQPARFHVARATVDPQQLEPAPDLLPKAADPGAMVNRLGPVELQPEKIAAFDGPLKVPSLPVPRLIDQPPAALGADSAAIPVQSFSALPLAADGQVPQVARALADAASTAALREANAALTPGNLAGGPGGAGGATAPRGVPGFNELSALADLRAPEAVPRPAAQPILIRLSSDVLFEFDSAQLKPAAQDALGQIATELARATRAQITVEGHTDTFGADAYNQRLSEARARAVADFLRQHSGLAAARITSRGYGKSRPIVNPQGTVDEQARNRRVEIRVAGER
ncbi:MAG: OmpA family protein [Verrucomicrobiales bacterium]|jgi:outer membrane protein OmpA-like peptidoglycan-associated protein|nr:OmpA family protein [Verrucomicrobiales bacterium]